MIEKGFLALVVGPSGAGKDMLISAAREALAKDRRFHFCRRVVTREADARSEDHATYTNQEFLEADKAGLFFLSWRSHGLHYALPSTVATELRADRIVIANVSRRVITLAEDLAQNVIVFSVIAPPEVLMHRLMLRGRETIDDIRDRIKREEPIVCKRARVVEIDNSGNPLKAVGRFIDGLRHLQQ